jgi:hypothetical protein
MAPQRALASPVSITSISVSSTCDAAGGFTGTVTLSGNASTTVTLGLYYHLTGGSQFLYSGVSTTVTFAGTSTGTYAFGPYTGPAGTNTYRIQVLNSGGLGGSTIKSNSVPPCSGTPPPPPPGPCSSTPGYTGPSTLGLCTQGSIPDVTDAGSPNGSQITVGSQAETVTSMCGDVVAVDPNPANDWYSFGIYTDAGGAPGTLVATSTPKTMTAAGWNCAPITAALSANTSYWLVFYSNADDRTNPSSSYGDLYYNNVSSPIGTFSTVMTTPGAPISWANYTPSFGPNVVGNWQYSIFANVTP